MLRIGDRIELVHAALHDGLAPVTAEIRQQRIHPRYRRMDIAVDAAALQAHGILDPIGDPRHGSRFYQRSP